MPSWPWWAVLYTLSMLARYEPAQWSACTNV
ncbi:YaaC family protein, partial [Streptomyces sp. NPDC057910]